MSDGGWARWWNDPATLPALGRDKNEASVRTSRVMVEGVENLHAVAVGSHESQKAFQVGRCVKGGSGLCAGQRAGGGKDAAVNAASVVEQVANGYLKLFLLGSGGGRKRVGGSSALRCRRAGDGGMIDGGGCGRVDPVGAKAV